MQGEGRMSTAWAGRPWHPLPTILIAMISFIVPAHNEERELGRTLTAIHAAAQAAAEPYEVIVVDDASTDATAEIAEQSGATVVSVNHRQIAATRNSGACAARGERLFFVDADTEINQRAVVAAMRAMDHGAAGGGAPLRLEGPLPLYARLLLLCLNIVMRVASLAGGAFLFCTRAAFWAVGGFDERLYAAEDAALGSALKRAGPFVVLWTPVRTSGRRVRTMSGLQMLVFIVSTLFRPYRTLTRRDAVERMWYESNRDESEERHGSLVDRMSNLVALLIMIVFVTGPLWMIPLPQSLKAGPLGTVKYAVRVFQCHIGLVLLPCAYFLWRTLLGQTRLIELIKTAVLFAVCLLAGVDSARQVFWSWATFLDWLIHS
jgi:glycosyltransferase involved in cell wall biosynthesis